MRYGSARVALRDAKNDERKRFAKTFPFDANRFPLNRANFRKRQTGNARAAYCNVRRGRSRDHRIIRLVIGRLSRPFELHRTDARSYAVAGKREYNIVYMYFG